MAQKWYAFKPSDKSGEVELSLYDEIGSFGIGAKDFIAELRQHKGQHIHLRINSPGGEIIDGTAIANALNRHEGGLTVHIDGLAASMASYIAMSGAPTYMAENALLMIHNPWTLAAGEAEDLRKQADLLDVMKSTLVRGYQRKSGMDTAEISKLMDEETWLTALEATALGFVDAIEDGIPAVASAKDLRARFDTYAKAKMENTIVSETEVAAPAAEPAVEEKPVTAETVETPAPAVEGPKQEEPAAVTAGALIEKLSELTAKLAEVEARATAAEAELAKVKDAFAALERGAGVAAAAVVPTVTVAEASDPVEQFKAASEEKNWKLCGELYAKHKAAIWAARNRK